MCILPWADPKAVRIDPRTGRPDPRAMKPDPKGAKAPAGKQDPSRGAAGRDKAAQPRSSSPAGDQAEEKVVKEKILGQYDDSLFHPVYFPPPRSA